MKSDLFVIAVDKLEPQIGTPSIGSRISLFDSWFVKEFMILFMVSSIKGD
jgi:hypothetical protein